MMVAWCSVAPAPGAALTNYHTPCDLKQEMFIFLPVLEARGPQSKCG